MITKFSLHNVATYKNKVEVSGLKKLNFFYGTNGSGKTTISRLLHNSTSLDFQNCLVTNPYGYKCYVYNQDFIDTHFYQNDSLGGVFTLGEDAEKAEIEISRISEEITTKRIEIQQKSKFLSENGVDSLKVKMRDVKLEKVNFFWDFKKELEENSSSIRRLLDGFHNSKDIFFNEVLRHSKNIDQDTSFDLEEIRKKAEVIFNENVQRKSEIVKISQDLLRVFYPINELSEVLVNSNTNNQISEIVSKLNHSSWFEQGVIYASNNENECPFCSQKIDDVLQKLIQNCFDQSYVEKKGKINIFLENYRTGKHSLLEVLKSKINELKLDFDVTEVEKECVLVDLILTDNISLIKKKLRDTNEIIELRKFSDHLKKIYELIDLHNEQVFKHNYLIDNLDKEVKLLKIQLWNLIGTGLKEQLDEYIVFLDGTNKKIFEISEEIQVIDNKIKELNLEKSTWTKKITSTQSSCDEINKLLKNFGFNNFSLQMLDDSGHYQINRDDGSTAKKTLSEGEKTFLTFLYFFQLIKGGETVEFVSMDKVVVLDDPISSLDSDVLFIISTLTKSLYQGIAHDVGNLKQLVILTHNIHFFIELTKLTYPWFKKNVSYYLVRKHSGVSCISHKLDNPIKSSYENLWSELQYFKDCKLQGIQNCMRRILETYFTHWGYSKDLAALIDRFTGNEKLVFKSLVNWTNSGSHQILDSFYVVDLEHETEIYLEIFRRIFVETDQIGHYNMMMRIEASEAAQSLISL